MKKLLFVTLLTIVLVPNQLWCVMQDGKPGFDRFKPGQTHEERLREVLTKAQQLSSQNVEDAEKFLRFHYREIAARGSNDTIIADILAQERAVNNQNAVLATIVEIARENNDLKTYEVYMRELTEITQKTGIQLKSRVITGLAIYGGVALSYRAWGYALSTGIIKKILGLR